MDHIYTTNLYNSVKSNNYNINGINSYELKELFFKNNSDFRDIDLCEVLMENGIDVNSKNSDDKYAISALADFPDENSILILNYLLRFAPSYSAIDAVLVECVKTRIINGENLLDDEDLDCIQIFNLLLPYVKDVNRNITEEGSLAHLCCSVFYKKFEYLPAKDLLLTLIKHGADIHHVNGEGVNVFDYLSLKSNTLFAYEILGDYY